MTTGSPVILAMFLATSRLLSTDAAAFVKLALRRPASVLSGSSLVNTWTADKLPKHRPMACARPDARAVPLDFVAVKTSTN